MKSRSKTNKFWWFRPLFLLIFMIFKKKSYYTGDRTKWTRTKQGPPVREEAIKRPQTNILYLWVETRKPVLKLLYVHVDEQLMLPLASSLIRDNYDPSTLFRYFSVSGYSQQIPLFSLKLSLQARVCKVQKILQND